MQSSFQMTGPAGFFAVFALLFITLLTAGAGAVRAGGFTNYQAAASVLGQTDFISGNAGTSASSLNLPNGVTVDRTTRKIFVADYLNNRVLRYASSAAYANGAAAEAVFGQPDFNTVSPGASASKMYQPVDVNTDSAGRLWVCDYNNNRVLRFDNASTKPSGADADGVLGQLDFTGDTGFSGPARFSAPSAVFADAGGRLWIVDCFNNRVLRFDDAAHKANGASADGVLGQKNLNTITSGLAANRFQYPFALTVDAAGRLYVADSQNYRVLRFDNAAAKPDNANADAVYGQTNFTTAVTGATPTKTGYATGVATDSSGRLYIADYQHNRVLVYNNSGTLPNGAPADYVLGQPDFTSYDPNNGGLSASSMNGPRHIFFDESTQSLLYAEGENNRVLRFNVPLGPTAASVTISGRVTTNGKGLSNARVELIGTGGATRTVLTNVLGNFTLSEVQSGATYVVNVSAKKYTFAPQVLTVTNDVSGLSFTAQ